MADELTALRQENERLKERLALYEDDGEDNLYNSLKRKMNETSKLLNKHSLAEIDISDKDNKSFDRIVKLVENSEKVANAAKALREFSNTPTVKERKPFVETIAENRR